MQPAAPAAGRLSIAQIDAVYRLSTHHPAPAAARLRLDRLVESRLPAALGQLLEGVLAADDPTLWLIKALDARLTCDLAAVDDARLAGALAASVGDSLLRTLAAGPRGDEVLRYRDRPAYVAAFLADLAAGRAWDRWQYQSFATLRSLPRSTAVVEALLREPAQVPAVLARLAEDGTFEAVLEALSEPAAGRLVAALVGETEGRGGGGDLPLLAELVERLGASGLPGDRLLAERRRCQLRLLAALAAEDPARLGDPRLGPSLAWAVDVASLAALPGGLDRALAGSLAAAVAELEHRGLGELVPALPALRDLARRHGLPGRLAAGPRERPGAGAGEEGAGERELVLESPCAGVFFLLPSYLALEVETLLADLGELLPAAERPSMRRLVLARALAGDAEPAAFADPALGLACGLPPRPAGTPPREELPARQGELAAALARLVPAWWEERSLRAPVLAGVGLAADDGPGAADGGPPGLEPGLAREAAAVARGLLRHFAARLPGFARASDGHLVRNFLAGVGRVRVATRPAAEGRGTPSPAAIEVELPPMPLAVVARLAGADGLTYELPWLGCPVTLRCAGG